ncbi:hypothetical protein DY000_02054339 [Brassica cretica]|uniref:Reverse transcriptase zinc-binding domain-containing protein n=1 Tax=Brassica cretica TaxID=69181 RepID=A0ABQ7A5B3_BRACR|nr:hypothetical protein DY000_02054339 [Brassica cretica]
MMTNIKFQDLGFDWASRLVHYMLGFQLDIKKKYELWSLVGPEPVGFSLLEFENLTGLNCEYIEDLERPHSEIIAALERCKGWSRDDRKWLAYLAIFTGYIEGRKYSTPTRVSLARLVMELERFENYPWGRVAFKVLMDSVKGRDISGCYTINGFAQALQVWVYTALPELGATFGNPLPNNPSPPILAYKGRKGRRQFKEAILSQYSTGAIYTYIQGPKPSVPWSAVVWCPMGIPRHSFLMWLVVLDRCPTKDRLLRWGLPGVNPICLLCNSQPESRDHLFFQCCYSETVWRTITLRQYWPWVQALEAGASDPRKIFIISALNRTGPALRCQFQSPVGWEQNLNHMIQLRGNKYLRRLTLMAIQATVYWLWNEHNKRHHQHIFRTTDSLIGVIDKQIRNRIQSFRSSNPRACSAMMQLWFVNS